MQRRRFALGLGSAALLAWACAGTAANHTGGSVRRIAIVARKFAFSARELHALAGESILLEVLSLDFMHGFALPELNARVDAPPGRTVELPLPGLRAGRYTYLCDNFCGEEHDRMTGVLVVAPGASTARRDFSSSDSPWMS